MDSIDLSPARMAERLRSGEVKISINVPIEPAAQAAEIDAWLNSVRDTMIKEYERQAAEAQE